MESNLSVIMTKMLCLLSDKRRTYKRGISYFRFVRVDVVMLEFYLNFVDDPVENLKTKHVLSISDILNNSN